MKKDYKTSELIREYLSIIIISAGLISYGICAKSCAEHKTPEGLEKKIENRSQSANSYKIEEKIFYEYLQRVMQKKD